jgi:hypothetical protein
MLTTLDILCQRKWMEKPTPSFSKLETKAFELLLPLLSTWVYFIFFVTICCYLGLKFDLVTRKRFILCDIWSKEKGMWMPIKLIIKSLAFRPRLIRYQELYRISTILAKRTEIRKFNPYIICPKRGIACVPWKFLNSQHTQSAYFMRAWKATFYLI